MTEKKVVVTKRPQYRMFKPHQLGWLRRSELGKKVWEKPDGTIIQFSPNQPELVVLRQAAKNG